MRPPTPIRPGRVPDLRRRFAPVAAKSGPPGPPRGTPGPRAHVGKRQCEPPCRRPSRCTPARGPASRRPGGRITYLTVRRVRRGRTSGRCTPPRGWAFRLRVRWEHDEEARTRPGTAGTGEEGSVPPVGKAPREARGPGGSASGRTGRSDDREGARCRSSDRFGSAWSPVRCTPEPARVLGESLPMPEPRPKDSQGRSGVAGPPGPAEVRPGSADRPLQPDDGGTG